MAFRQRLTTPNCDRAIPGLHGSHDRPSGDFRPTCCDHAPNIAPEALAAVMAAESSFGVLRAIHDNTTCNVCSWPHARGVLMTAQHDASPPDLPTDTTFCGGSGRDVAEATALGRQLRVAFGRNLRQARVNADLTQDELAALSRLPVHCVREIEEGARDPRLKDMFALACAVRRDVWTLLTLPAA